MRSGLVSEEPSRERGCFRRRSRALLSEVVLERVRVRVRVRNGKNASQSPVLITVADHCDIRHSFGGQRAVNSPGNTRCRTVYV